jgi:nucleoside-diphosphate-sugar epimerase
MRVLVAGASGVVGRPLVDGLLANGHDVIALSRRPSAGSQPRRGVTEVTANAFIAEDLFRALANERADAVVSELTALKKPPSQHRHLAETNRLRTVGTANLLRAAKQLGARRFVTQSMMFGYGYDNQGSRLRLESEPFAPPRSGPFEQHLSAMRENEDRVLGDHDLDGIALRYGLFYGGGASDMLLDGVRKRTIPVTGDASPLSFVHVDDAATATVAALQRGAAGQAFNVADEEPVSWTTFVCYVASRVGAPRPIRVPRWLISLIAPYAKVIFDGGVCISTAKAQESLGWTPVYRSYRDGIEEMIDARAAARDKRSWHAQE